MQRIQSHSNLESQLPSGNPDQGYEVSHRLWINQWNIIPANRLFEELFQHPVEASK